MPTLPWEWVFPVTHAWAPSRLATVLLLRPSVLCECRLNVVSVCMKASKTFLSTILLHGLLWPLCLTLVSCGFWVRTQSWMGKELDVTVRLDELANHNSPIAVDVLFVHDKTRLSELMQLPAKEWFRQKSQIQKDAQGDPGFLLWEWEWVPGQFVPVQHLPLHPRARAGLIFANYQSPGDHRARVAPHEDISLHLGRDEFSVVHP
jgi:type VI secretion system protein